MRVFVLCEFSGEVRDAFARRGHDAWSCDVVPSERGGKHFQMDCRDLDYTGVDLVIAHTPCTHICRQANRWNTTEERLLGFEQDMSLFEFVGGLPVRRICRENPIPAKKSKDIMGQYSQIINPWQFGHDYAKKTCLWLKGLPLLKSTKIVPVTYYVTPNGRRYTYGWYMTPRNSVDRSRTFRGIADAMAEQWGSLE